MNRKRQNPDLPKPFFSVIFCHFSVKRLSMRYRQIQHGKQNTDPTSISVKTVSNLWSIDTIHMNLAIIQAKKLRFFCRHFDPKTLYSSLIWWLWWSRETRLDRIVSVGSIHLQGSWSLNRPQSGSISLGGASISLHARVEAGISDYSIVANKQAKKYRGRCWKYILDHVMSTSFYQSLL